MRWRRWPGSRAPTSRQLSALNGERKACNWRSIESRSIVACGSVAGDSRHVVVVVVRGGWWTCGLDDAAWHSGSVAGDSRHVVVVVVSGAGGPVGWPTPLESRC